MGWWGSRDGGDLGVAWGSRAWYGSRGWWQSGGGGCLGVGGSRGGRDLVGGGQWVVGILGWWGIGVGVKGVVGV